MDRLKMIEAIRAEIDVMAPWMDPGERAHWAGRIADAIIGSGALRSFRTGGEGDGGDTMPDGPWHGSA